MPVQPQTQSASNQLKSLLDRRNAIAAPGCHDPLGAMLIEQAGFEVLSLSGYSVAASHGKPDIGLISGTQMNRQACEVAQSVTIPLVADADTGYGGISNIAQTVMDYERSGIAGLHLEDQLNPKRCGAMASKALASDEEMSQRIRTAVAVRREILIIGRTDALTISGMDEVIRRCKRMADDGADAVMVPSLSSLKDIERIVRHCPVPVLHTVAETVRPLFTQTELASTGLGMALYSISLIQAIVHAQQRILAELRDNGTTSSMVSQMTPLTKVTELLGAPRYAELEARILSEGR